VTQASESRLPAEVAVAVGEFEAAVAEADAEIAEAREQLARERAEPMDPRMAAALRQAARNPDAPESLRRLAKRVGDGTLDWSAVLDGDSTDPDVRQFRAAAFATAQAHFDVPDTRDGEPPAPRGAGRRR
jgi:hypothetical protein